MAYYRLYFLDGFSGHIDQVRDFEAENDSAAIACAEEMRGRAPMELWARSRKVKHWETGGPIAADSSPSEVHP
jgi:hypothetical protein